MQEDDFEDLPSVNDLDIAARAAAGAPDPVGPVLRQALGEEVEEDELLEPQAEAAPASVPDSLLHVSTANHAPFIRLLLLARPWRLTPGQIKATVASLMAGPVPVRHAGIAHAFH
jgi:hypothetical protein